MAYLFSGKSGSGKSTVCKLLATEPSFAILHDDMNAITRNEKGFCAWSTPLSGEFPARLNIGAPLRAIFFLKHAQTNCAIRLSCRQAAGLLALGLAPPLVATNGSLVNDGAESLEKLLNLAECIPCYELHFRPERSFWECIPSLFENESINEAIKERV
jgi:hypothetical protein